MTLERMNWILCSVGAIFLLVGIPFVWIALSTTQAVNQLEQLPALSATLLADSAVGQVGVIEGRISERNPLQFRTFVAYIRQVYEGEKCTRDDDREKCEAIWTEDERITPPLWLDLPDGRVHIINSDYTLKNARATWQSTTGLVAYETRSYRGFEINDPVFAVVQVVLEAEDRAFKAEFISGGDQTTYVTGERTLARIFFWLGLVISLVGTLLLGWQIRWLFVGRSVSQATVSRQPPDGFHFMHSILVRQP